MANSRIVRIAAAALALAPAFQTARAAEPPRTTVRPATQRDPASPGPVTLEAGAGRVFRTGGTISSVFAADPKVIEVRPASHNAVFIFGVAPGRTTVAALDEAGNTLSQFDVTVLPSSYGASEAGATARRTVPGANVQFSGAQDGIVVNGQVSSPAAANDVAEIAKNYIGEKQTVENRTRITSPVQVTLNVRIAEISRTITRQLGINWTALANLGRWGLFTGIVTDGLSSGTNAPNTLGFAGHNGSINTVLDLLAQDQLITMLAEPNLTARSGESASFLAGGEFPIPIAGQNNQITLAFKQYGVSLAFVPTVLSDGRISLHVHPEVSALTTVGAISLPIGGLLSTSTITVPALTVRRADTTVELGSGQSFAIAGLLSSNNAMDARGLPYVGELPVIGALFKSDLFQRDKSELVIVVTPYIVKPVGSPNQLHIPTDDFVPAGDTDRVLLMRQRARDTGPGTMIAPSMAALGSNTHLGAGDLPSGAGFILN